ncbi:MAG TPA: hypothetical protein DDW52_22670 [Planctomycetaceae bacterium]|nr:hypothetical protein [Planctomycetaceae bacterium]
MPFALRTASNRVLARHSRLLQVQLCQKFASRYVRQTAANKEAINAEPIELQISAHGLQTNGNQVLPCTNFFLLALRALRR